MIKVVSPANIAFIKHWGMTANGLPLTPSLSMNLSNCLTTTTVSGSENGIKLESDLVELENFDGSVRVLQRNIDERDDKVFEQINLIRNLSKKKDFVKIRSKNSFPTKSGIASSASGFSALTMALSEYFGIDYDLQKMANLVAKAGSISAVRSLCNNFGEVNVNKNGLLVVKECNEFLKLELIDIVVVVNYNEKHSSSLDGQKVSATSPFYKARLQQVKKNFLAIKTLAQKKDWPQIGAIIEQEAIMLHSVMLSSNPILKYINVATLSVIELVLRFRSLGIEAYFTIDAGANVHIISNKINQEQLCNELKKLECVKDLIVNSPCQGTHIMLSK